MVHAHAAEGRRGGKSLQLHSSREEKQGKPCTAEQKLNMVFLLVKITCELENLTNLRPESDDFTYYFKVKCGSCGEISSKESSVSKDEMVEGQSGRNKVHLQQKCSFCARVGTITIVDGHGKPYTAEDSESRAFVPLVCFDCRGIEVVEFLPKDGWAAEGAESGTKFSEIDLSDGDYSEYDEKATASVGIFSFVSEVTVTRL